MARPHSSKQQTQAGQTRFCSETQGDQGSSCFHGSASERDASCGEGRRRRMSPFPDTSFLCALYREQDNSKRADRRFNLLREPLAVSSLLLLEFRQSVRFQIGLHDRDKTKGFSGTEGKRMLEDLKSDLDSGALKTVSVEWV